MSNCPPHLSYVSSKFTTLQAKFLIRRIYKCKTHRIWLFSTALSIILIILTVAITSAFTLYTRVFPTASTTYTIDSSFSSQNSGWAISALDAATNWNNTGVFSFVYDSNSSNHLQAGAITDPNVLARTYPYYSGFKSTGFNIVVDPGNGPWYDGTQWPTVPLNYYDLRSVVRHELGHALGLFHTNNIGSLMYPNTSPGTVMQIGTDDLYGANYLYNPNFAGASPEGAGAYNAVPQGKYDSSDVNVGYVNGSWINNNGFSRSYNQTVAYNNAQGSKVWIAFNGTSITRHFTMANNRGTGKIYIDGVEVETINDYAPTTRWQVAKTWSVSPGSHVWELRLNGSGSYLDSDAITINTSYLGSGSYDDSDITPSSYVGSWTHYSGTGPYNNGVYFTKTTENAVKFTFSGSSITYVFTKATNRGKAAVTIDGIDKGVLDLYFGSTQWQQSKTYDNLGSGIHTIHIAVSGDKNINSTDYYIDLDRFIVQ